MAALLLYTSPGPEVDYRYRLTIEIETPQGLVSTSNVIETRWRDNTDTWWHFRLGEAAVGSLSHDVSGDAVFVDLGDGKNVVAALRLGPTGLEDQSSIDGLVPALFDVDWWGGEFERLAPAAEKALADRAVFVLPRELTPTLVTFADLSDPYSGRVVNPTTGDFSSVFGPDYRFRRATVQLLPVGIWPFNAIGLSGEPITRTIDTQIPFVRDHRDELSRILTNLPRRWQPHHEFFTR